MTGHSPQDAEPPERAPVSRGIWPARWNRQTGIAVIRSGVVAAFGVLALAFGKLSAGIFLLILAGGALALGLWTARRPHP